jgi:energy-coupling factor transporter transmembrane protein EcfT
MLQARAVSNPRNVDARSLVIPFARGRHAAVVLAVGLFAIIFAARLTIHGTDPITMFLIFPVALLAMAFGLRAGLVAGLVGVALIVVWVALQGISLSALGWMSRIVPILLLGVLVGWTTDRERTAEQAQRDLFEARLREREAAEINDSIVQRLAVAKWTMESGHTDEGLTMLADTIATSESLVGALLRHEPLPH